MYILSNFPKSQLFVEFTEHLFSKKHNFNTAVTVNLIHIFITHLDPVIGHSSDSHTLKEPG